MAFEALAYGPETNVLLVLDGAELIAYDAHTESPKWQVVFPDPLLSVLFAHPQALYGGGSSLWGVGEDEDSKEVLLHRAPTGAWSTKTPTLEGSTLIVRSLWVSPGGETFVGTSSSVLRSKDGGASWTEVPRPDAVVSLWGRSSTDLYSLEGSGLVHFDGKIWSSINDDLPGAQSLTGTPTEVLVLRASAP